MYDNLSVLSALIYITNKVLFTKVRPSNNQHVDTLARSLSICLIGYQLTDADMKKLQSYLKSLEPDRYPPIIGNTYISMLLYTVVVVTSLLCLYTWIYNILVRVIVSTLVSVCHSLCLLRCYRVDYSQYFSIHSYMNVYYSFSELCSLHFISLLQIYL